MKLAEALLTRAKVYWTELGGVWDHLSKKFF